ncbi:dihydrofolate reductase-like domain-containing protein [Clohesyomyces aquaticus]|uniref:Dihydrofolate reductase n=1 Tax=Clohesyomyces aquaticus TaxID=1231657 RepID=A0A1Y1YNS4_9PLEO|nr:dihydrofolate reductase-like domain-containing protein [Clohesyomyces aquaticus]
MSETAAKDSSNTSNSLELTMITAAERSNGIGHEGDLPWRLKQELKYFTRVTRRVPHEASNTMNAVIMGRKSWDPLPDEVRPLPGRINVILSRSPKSLWSQIQKEGRDTETTHVVGSLEEGIELLHRIYAAPTSDVKLGRVFVLGGTEIFTLVLRLQSTVRLLLTRIHADFECDTFFPDFLADMRYGGWKRQDQDRLGSWVGEDVASGRVTENGVEYEFMMYERRGGF